MDGEDVAAARCVRALGLLGAEPEEGDDDEGDIVAEEERRGEGDLALAASRRLHHQHVGGLVRQRLDGA